MTIYESAADRANEEEIVRIVCERRHWKHYKKLPQLNPLDWRIYRSDRITTRGYLIVKNRPTWAYSRGDGYRISYTKVVASDSARATHGIGARLAVRFPNQSDDIWWTRLCGPYRTIFDGRYDRPNDPKAIEKLAVIEWSDFELVNASGV